ncbi:MAG: SpoIIE family protein phosphatase [Pseudomonadota bacterium]
MDGGAGTIRIGEGYRILVVDDSATQRIALSAHLKRWGFTVLEAQNGIQALEVLDTSHVDMVLTDWMMPELDGPSLCRAIRERPGDGFIYIVLLTSRTGSAAVSDGLDAGADDFLMKPVNAVELKARLTAGTRIVSMERRLAGQKQATEAALKELQKLYDAVEVDLAAAAVLQRDQLPPADAVVNGCRIATLCRFASHVGGDHVGFFEIGEDKVGLYSIDVAGHGVAAALLAVRLAQYFAPPDPSSNIALQSGPNGVLSALPLDVVMTELNRRCRASMEHDIYFTMAYAVVELSSGAVQICQAGHSPAAVLAPSGDVRFEEVGAGPPVGLFDLSEYSVGTFTLAPGERLILYSDGITEAETGVENEAEDGAEGDGMLGTCGFARLLRGLKHEPVAGLLPKLADTLQAATGGRGPDDDVSAVLFELCPEPAALTQAHKQPARSRLTAPTSSAHASVSR